MSSRPQFNPFPVITNGNMGSASLTSLVTIIQKLSIVSYDIAWSAGSTPVGDITVEVSNTYSLDASGAVANAGTWTAIALSSPIHITGNSGNAFVSLSELGAYAIRVKYTRTSGSGTLNVTVAGKVA